MEEPNLLDDARKMNGDALSRLFDLYAPAIYKYALRFCNDAFMADQVVGDVFSKLLEQLSAGKGPRSNIRSYIFEMAYHILLNEVRYSRRVTPIEVVELTHPDGHPIYVSVENRMLFDDILRAIQNDLTDDQKHVIILRFFEGFNLKETAVILGKSITNIKVTQHRAILCLQNVVERGAGITPHKTSALGVAA
jgi:RNA polymerase sigma-70 factor (ECF subfamily)